MNVPKIRFKEFTDDWYCDKLSTYAKKITTKNKNLEVKNVISNSAIYGLISQRDFFDKDIANEINIDSYYIIDNNDFVYNPRKSNEAPYGPINRFSSNEKGVISPLYLCFGISNKINNLYLEKYFKSSKWHRYIYLNGDAGARHDRVSIKDETFFDLNMYLPSTKEQEKIGLFLTLLDKKIELQSKKIEALKLYKKGLQIKCFSNKHPNSKLKDLVNYAKAGGTPKSTNSLYYTGNIPFLSISDMTKQGKLINNTEKNISKSGLQNSSAWLVPINSLILSMYASYGLVSINKIELATSQAMYSMILKDNVNLEYIYQYLNYLYNINYYDNIVSTGTQANLNAEKVNNLDIYIPNIENQIKLSNLLNKADKLIYLNENLLLQLKQLKKGLMQNMFV